MSIHDQLDPGNESDDNDRRERDTAEVIPLHRQPGETTSGDQLVGAGSGEGESGQRSPIIPDFLRRGQFGVTVRSGAWLGWYRFRFHVVRVQPIWAGWPGTRPAGWWTW